MTPRLAEIGNQLLEIGNPVSWSKLADLCQWLELGSESRVLDLGAGKGEVMLRLAASYGCRGVVLEQRPKLCERAATEAHERGLTGIEVICADARSWLETQSEAFDAIICLGSSGALGGYVKCLSEIGAWLKPGGCLLLGETYWQREPDPAYLEASGMALAEMLSHAQTVALARELGWEYLMAYTASQDEWDVFEGRYHLSVRQHLRLYPDDPDAEALDRAMSHWHRNYLEAGRETLGFGVYLLRKTGAV
jgi:cyclopropane fatty-acyl-phospholipid synthase-like methyltransferase